MKLIQNLLIAILTFLSSVEIIYSQQAGAKDCFEAVPLINWETINYLSSSGEGLFPDEVSGDLSCLNSGERNSSWFKFYTTSAGLVRFNIIPICDADYDFAVYDITDFGCADIATNSQLEVSCNFSGATFPNPITGANGGPNPQDSPPIQAAEGRIYALLVNNFTGSALCAYSIDFSGSTAQLGSFNEIIGHVNYDNNDVCFDNIEMPMHNQRVEVFDDNGELLSIAHSNVNGLYKAFLPSGQATISVALANVLEPFEPSCFPSEQTITFTSDTGQNVTNVDFAVRPTQICSQYDFDYSALFFRRCFSTTSFVKIANRGTTSSELDFTLTYPSDQVYPLSASIPFESIGNNTYLFHAPAINIFQQLIVSILDTTTCENLLGSFVCVEGELLNTNNCYIEDEEALKLVLSGNLLTNQIVVSNIGETAMPNYFTLFINNDYDTLNNMFQTSNSLEFLLQPNESINANIFSENWTSVVVDNNGNVESLFISNQNNISSSDTLIDLPFQSSDTECSMVIGSYDPNDKQGFPAGFGELNRIEKEQNIHYRIRFQNTGSDTAFTVVVLDTLSEFLDYNSIIPGASSHPYIFSVEENKLEFRFNNIRLVQKSVNEPASIGFVDFRIKQKASNPNSYTIENQAAIYFDFNEPIYTPIHIYSIYPLPLGLKDAEQMEMNVSPNPSSGMVTLSFTNKWQGTHKTIQISDLAGRLINTIETSDMTPSFNWSELPQGTYIITVASKLGMRISSRWIKI